MPLYRAFLALRFQQPHQPAVAHLHELNAYALVPSITGASAVVKYTQPNPLRRLLLEIWHYASNLMRTR
jgi:hypothetical protein